MLFIHPGRPSWLVPGRRLELLTAQRALHDLDPHPRGGKPAALIPVGLQRAVAGIRGGTDSPSSDRAVR